MTQVAFEVTSWLPCITYATKGAVTITQSLE